MQATEKSVSDKACAMFLEQITKLARMEASYVSEPPINSLDDSSSRGSVKTVDD